MWAMTNVCPRSGNGTRAMAKVRAMRSFNSAAASTVAPGAPVDSKRPATQANTLRISALPGGRTLGRGLLWTEQARQAGRSALCTRAPHCEMPFEPRFPGFGPREHGFVGWRCSVAADSLTIGPVESSRAVRDRDLI